MRYLIRQATVLDVTHIVQQREQMFREMGTACDYEKMAEACTRWYQEAVRAGTYSGWMIEEHPLVNAKPGEASAIVGGGGLIVMPWSPGPFRLDPRMAFVYNVYVERRHRGHHLGRKLMLTMQAWCREAGIERMALNATAAGRHVYEGLGYAVIAEPMMRLDL